MTTLRSRLLSALLVLLSGCDETDTTLAGDAGIGESFGELAASLSTGPKKRPDAEGKRRPKSILLAEARELVGWRVADGFLSREEIVEAALEAVDGRA